MEHINQELQYYHDNLEMLEELYANQFLLISGYALLDVFDKKSLAIQHAEQLSLNTDQYRIIQCGSLAKESKPSGAQSKWYTEVLLAIPDFFYFWR